MQSGGDCSSCSSQLLQLEHQEAPVAGAAAAGEPACRMLLLSAQIAMSAVASMPGGVVACKGPLRGLMCCRRPA